MQTLLECNHDRVIAAGQSCFSTLNPRMGIRGPGDNPTPPIGPISIVTTRVTMDQVLTPKNDSFKEEHTGSSRYALEDSAEDSNDSIETQRMFLVLRNADLLRKKLKLNEAEAQPGKPSATQFMNMVESD